MHAKYFQKHEIHILLTVSQSDNCIYFKFTKNRIHDIYFMINQIYSFFNEMKYATINYCRSLTFNIRIDNYIEY